MMREQVVRFVYPSSDRSGRREANRVLLGRGGLEACHEE